MLKDRKFQMLVVIALIVIALMATASAINPTYASRADLSWPSRPDFWHLREENVAPSSYRSRVDECFDVPMRELAQCRSESQTLSIIPVTGGQDSPDLSDYYQRHVETNSVGVFAEASDYIMRHPELR